MGRVMKVIVLLIFFFLLGYKVSSAMAYFLAPVDAWFDFVGYKIDGKQIQLRLGCGDADCDEGQVIWRIKK